MQIDNSWSLEQNLKDYYTYCENVLPDILKALPLGNHINVGIYGRGRHTKLMLTAYKTLVGKIDANITFIDVPFDPYAEIYVGENAISVKDINKENFDAIILSSSDYEDRLFKSLVDEVDHDVLKNIPIYRFYDKYKSDIFWQQWQMVRFPDKPFSELPVLKFKVADVFKGSYDNPLSCVMDKYKLVVSDEPDIYIYMCYGNDHLGFTYPCIRVAFWGGESHLPDWNDCDYAITTREMPDEPRHYRYNAMEPYNTMIQNRSQFMKKDMADRKFCNFVYSNGSYGEGALLRQDFCKRLMNYKYVDCPGKVLNNMKDAITPREEDWSRGKVEFIRNYKFTIAFENERIDGYTTEKLYHPLRAGSIPIYWGNPLIGETVDNRCFINCNEYDNDFDAVIERVKEIDNDPELYLYMLGISPMKKGYRFDHYDGLEAFWMKIIEEKL